MDQKKQNKKKLDIQFYSTDLPNSSPYNSKGSLTSLNSFKLKIENKDLNLTPTTPNKNWNTNLSRHFIKRNDKRLAMNPSVKDDSTILKCIPPEINKKSSAFSQESNLDYAYHTVSKRNVYNQKSQDSNIDLNDFMSSLSIFKFKMFADTFVRAGVNLFNESVEKGLIVLFAQGFLKPVALEVAQFLKYSQFITKDSIGYILGAISHNFFLCVLEKYVGLFDFTNIAPETALRMFLESFKMIGEAQKIQKVLECFADNYYQLNKNSSLLVENNMNSVDSIMVLTYALLMLNTDLHNTTVKVKMSIDEFIYNIRGADLCKDIPEKYLERLYHFIQKKEIKTESNHTKQVNNVYKLIGGKINFKLEDPTRHFIAMYDVSEVKGIINKERVHTRSLFLFSDLLVVTKHNDTKLMKKSLLTIPIQYVYLYHFELSDIDIIRKSSLVFDYMITINDINKKPVISYDCYDACTQKKIFSDLKQFSKDSSTTKQLRQRVNKNELKFFLELYGEYKDGKENIFEDLTKYESYTREFRTNNFPRLVNLRKGSSLNKSRRVSSEVS